MSPPEVERLLGESLARVQALQPSRQSTAREALTALRALVEPILGRAIVQASVAMAFERLGAKAEGMPAPRWAKFVSAFSDSISGISGVAAGSLVRIAGVSLGAGLRAEGGRA